MDFRAFTPLILQAWLHKRPHAFCCGASRTLPGTAVRLTWPRQSPRFPRRVTGGKALSLGLSVSCGKVLIEVYRLSQRTLLCGSWKDKTCFSVVETIGHTDPLFSYLRHSTKWGKFPLTPASRKSIKTFSELLLKSNTKTSLQRRKLQLKLVP